jgi:ubiquinone/menaquinone biosynthesis C-methylase UbiE
MKPLFLNNAIRHGLGDYLRPGGEQLTQLAISMLQMDHDAPLLDAGCGNGSGMRILKQSGFRHLLGIEQNTQLAGEARAQGQSVSRGDMANLPLSDQAVQAVFCECAWNLSAKTKTLAEFYRVLIPGGFLVLSDIFVHSTSEQRSDISWPKRSCFYQADTLDASMEMVRTAGFRIDQCRDVSQLLRQAAAEFVFAHGSLIDFWRAVLGNDNDARAACSAAKMSKPGLFLLIAQKTAAQ